MKLNEIQKELKNEKRFKTYVRIIYFLLFDLLLFIFMYFFLIK